MKIGVLSGKGGTGKTTVSTNLASLLKANYIDCDVEEPNGFIFLNPTDTKSYEVEVDYPFVDDEKCTMCGECVKACQFNALAKLKDDLMLFEKLCHGCGACKIACKQGAIKYKKRPIGIIEEGRYKNTIAKRGLLNISEPMAVPIIDELIKKLDESVTILDFAPGTSCNVVSSLEAIDFAVLVTEPTKFGLHDLKMAVKLVKEFKKPFGIVINKNLKEEKIIDDYAKKENIKIIGRIPYLRDIALKYSNGEMLVDTKEYENIFLDIALNIKELIKWR